MKRRQAVTTAAFSLGSAALAACGGLGRQQQRRRSPAVMGGDQPRVRWRHGHQLANVPRHHVRRRSRHGRASGGDE
nr:hypothetical protein [Candidatus Synechococcus spongiarum]